MTTFPILSEDSLDPAQAKLWSELNSSHRAILTGGGRKPRMPDLFNAWLHFPEFARHAFAMADTLRAAKVLPDKLRELVVLTASMQLDTRVEYEFHIPMARSNGLSDAIIDAIGRSELPDFEDRDEALFYQATVELVRMGTLGESTRRAVVESVGFDGLMVLIALVSLYFLVGTTSNVAHGKLHEDFSADKDQLDAFYRGELVKQA